LHPLPQAWRLRFRSALNAPPPHHRRLPPAAPLPLSSPPPVRAREGRAADVLNFLLCINMPHVCSRERAHGNGSAPRPAVSREREFCFCPAAGPGCGRRQLCRPDNTRSRVYTSPALAMCALHPVTLRPIRAIRVWAPRGTHDVALAIRPRRSRSGAERGGGRVGAAGGGERSF
jgi:hypothetical protein